MVRPGAHGIRARAASAKAQTMACSRHRPSSASSPSRNRRRTIHPRMARSRNGAARKNVRSTMNAGTAKATTHAATSARVLPSSGPATRLAAQRTVLTTTAHPRPDGTSSSTVTPSSCDPHRLRDVVARRPRLPSATSEDHTLPCRDVCRDEVSRCSDAEPGRPCGNPGQPRPREHRHQERAVRRRHCEGGLDLGHRGEPGEHRGRGKRRRLPRLARGAAGGARSRSRS